MSSTLLRSYSIVPIRRPVGEGMQRLERSGCPLVGGVASRRTWGNLLMRNDRKVLADETQ